MTIHNYNPKEAEKIQNLIAAWAMWLDVRKERREGGKKKENER